MKIFYICYENLNVQAAWTTHIKEVTENLKKIGNEVHLFAPDIGKFRKDTTIEVTYVPTVNIRFVREYLYYIILFFCLFFSVPKKRPHLLYVREMGINVTPLIISKIFTIPHVTEVNGPLLLELKQVKAHPIKLFVFKYFRMCNYKWADKIISVSFDLTNYLIDAFQLNPGKITTISNGVNPDHFNIMDKNEAKLKVNLDVQKKYITFVGSFYPHHGVECIIDAMPHLNEKRKDIRLLLIGEGYQRPILEKKVKQLGLHNTIHFLGEVDHSDIPFYINASEFCISFGPRSSVKTHEYMACGKPLLASKGGDQEDFVIAHRLGLSVDISNPHDIAHNALKLSGDEALQKEFGQNGRRLVIENCTWEITARNILNTCKALMRD